METKEEIINNEVYNIITLESGHIIKELKMTQEQKALLENQKTNTDPFFSIHLKLDQIIKDITRIMGQKELVKK